MSIHYGSTEENNKRREKEFLALSRAERLLWFLNSIEKFNSLPNRVKKVKSNNFIIQGNGKPI